MIALGNTQEYGIDYGETFAPVAKMTTIRTVPAIATAQPWPLYQFDVKIAFLHGDLKEELSMHIPQGVSGTIPCDVVCLCWSLYCLKQAPRAWFEKFREAVLQLKFHQRYSDPSMFLHNTEAGIIVLLVYVDGIIISGTDAKMIQHLQASLHDSFHMKDLGPLTYFLGLEVLESKKGLILNQYKYVIDLVEMASLQVSSPVETPLEVNVKLSQDIGNPLPDPTLYYLVVGSLVYLTITGPNISYAINLVNQFVTDPRHLHLAVVRHIRCYIIGTSTRGLFFPTGKPMCLTAYSDADW